MRKPVVIALVLMGGGAVAATALTMRDNSRQRECEEARRQNLPNMAEICARAARSSWSSSNSHSSGYYSSGSRSSWWSGRSSSSSGTTAVSSNSATSRGGFGFTGSSHSSSGS